MEKSIIKSDYYQEFLDVIDNMYRLGWHERNSGNISMMIEKEKLEKYINVNDVKRSMVLKEKFPNLINKYFIVTKAGEHFRNIKKHPQEKSGIIRVGEKGNEIQIIWGFGENGRPTSEIETHLMTHNLKIAKNKNHRVVMHAHPTNLVAMSFVHELDDRLFTRTLWKMSTECITVFPEGIGVLPWMVCGNSVIGSETIKKMEKVNAVIWALHGVFSVGNSLDDAFGLLETMEKSAEIYMKTRNLKVLQVITDEELRALTKEFNIKPREEFLE